MGEVLRAALSGLTLVASIALIVYAFVSIRRTTRHVKETSETIARQGASFDSFAMAVLDEVEDVLVELSREGAPPMTEAVYERTASVIDTAMRTGGHSAAIQARGAALAATLERVISKSREQRRRTVH